MPDQTATESVAYLLDLRIFFTDPDGDDLLITYAFSNLPDGLTGSMLGEISGMPALDTSIRECDTGEVGLTVSDGLDALLTTFCLRVLEAGRADLALSLAAAPAPALINQPVDWTFTIENLSVESVGNVAIDAVFSGQVPFTLSDAPNCTTMPQGNQTLLSCTAGPIAGEAVATVAVSGSSTQAGDVLTTATVSITDPIPLDLNPENDSASGALNVAQTLAAGAGQKLTVTEHRASAVGDLNGDGFADLVVATGAAQSTQVYANIVDPADPGGNKRAFSELPTSLGDQGPGGAVALADLDGNGALDIVTANRAGQANRIFMNMSTGDGSFEFALLPDALGAPEAVSNAAAIADLDGDGDLDIVFANSSPNPVFINDGSTFNQTEALGNDESRELVVVDLYGDPLPELVFANADDDATIYSYNSAGDFYDVAALATGPTTSVAVGDFDADGRADLVFGRGATALGVPSNPVFLNTTMNGTGQFFLAAELGASPTNDVLVIDTDDDTDLDIVAINATGGHQIFANNGNGDFTLHAQQFSSTGATAASFGKLSVDDRIDVAVSGRAGIDVFYNDGLGNLGPGDTGSPVIQLLGQAAIELIVEAEYTDAGATAMDTIDGDLTEMIVVDNPVDTAVLGTYTVTYSVVDTSGNAATPVTRSVTVAARTGTGGGGGGAFSLGMALFLATLSLARALHHRRLRLSWSHHR